MDLLKKCQDYYDELRTLDDALAFLDKKLSKFELDDKTNLPIDIQEYERCYQEQFKLALNMVDCYHSLFEALDSLEKEDNMKFFCTRMRKNANDLLKVEVINVTEEF